MNFVGSDLGRADLLFCMGRSREDQDFHFSPCGRLDPAQVPGLWVPLKKSLNAEAPSDETRAIGSGRAHATDRARLRIGDAMKTFALSLAAVISAGNLLVASTPEARAGYRGHSGHHHGYHRHVHRDAHRYHGRSYRHGADGAVVAGAALGLIGAAIAASRAPYDPYYSYGSCYGACCGPYIRPSYRGYCY